MKRGLHDIDSKLTSAGTVLPAVAAGARLPPIRPPKFCGLSGSAASSGLKRCSIIQLLAPAFRPETDSALDRCNRSEDVNDTKKTGYLFGDPGRPRTGV